MNIKASMFLWICVILAGKLSISFCPLWAHPAGTISIAHVEAEPDTQVDVPVTVTGFHDFDIFQFTIQYDQEGADYVDIVDIHSVLESQTFIYGAEDSNIFVTFFGSGNGHTIPDGEVLFNIRFSFCTDQTDCALNGSLSDIFFDMTGQNYLSDPDLSNISLSYNPGSIYANPPFRILTINLTGEGSASVDGIHYTEQLIAVGGTTVELQAIPAEGWIFQGWSGDLTGSENPATIIMDDHKDITASFSYEDPGVPVDRVIAENEDLTIGSEDGPLCFDALVSITLPGKDNQFTVLDGGQVTLIAGQSIQLKPGTIISAGAYLHAYIAPDQTFCAASTTTEEHVTKVPEANQMRVGPFFKVYPNPSTGTITIDLSDPVMDEETVIEVFGMNGELVIHKKLPAERSYQLSLDGKRPGVYFVRIATKGQVGVERIIKR